MSDVSDRIIFMLTDEWQTTREIADLADVDTPQRAYKTLCKEFRYGLVE